MNTHAAIEATFRNFVISGLIHHDADALLALLTDDIMGFGVGEQGFVASKDDVLRVLESGLKQAEEARYELEFEDLTITVHHEVTASACARIMVTRTDAEGMTRSGIMQSTTMRREGDCWLICAIHASPIVLTKESIGAYPLKFAENTLAQLKSELQTETFDLMNKAFSGGILGCYAGERHFPLYFVNDSMLAYLNFTRDDIDEASGNDVLTLVHEDDRPVLGQTFRHTLESGEDYELPFRVRKKDGDYLWMLGRGRKATDENGYAVLLNILMDITEIISLQHELKAQASALSISEERFRIALEKTSHIIFDYDISAGSIMHSASGSRQLEQTSEISTAAEKLIPGGVVAPGSRADFLQAFEAVRKGTPQSECVVRAQLHAGGESWNRITMTGITDTEGRPVRAIGMIEDITRQREAEVAYAREEQMRRVILANSPASYVVNFTRGVFESCKVNSPLCRVVRPDEPYDEFLYHASKAQLGKEERLQFVHTFSRLNVIHEFEKGNFEIHMDYELFNFDGTTTWMRTTLRTMMETSSKELKGFLYVTDIDKAKRAELDLRYKSERDTMTGLLNKGASEARISARLGDVEEQRNGLFMILDVDHFKDINDTYGHPFGDSVLVKTAAILCEAFRESDIVGRLGGDEFCVFSSGIRSRERAMLAAGELCRAMREMFTPEPGKPGVSCSIGIVRCGGYGKDFHRLYQEADTALYHAKAAGRDRYAFYEDYPAKADA